MAPRDPGNRGTPTQRWSPQVEQNSGRKARVHLLVPGLPQGAPERRPWDTDLLSNPGHCEETRSGLDRDLQGRPRPTPRFSAASATVNRSGFGVLPVMKRPGSRNIAGLRRRGRLGRSRCRPHRRDPDDLPAWDALETPGLIGWAIAALPIARIRDTTERRKGRAASSRRPSGLSP